jgi:GAF domain-containing protein
VFNAILENATRLCDAINGGLFKYENGEIDPVALRNAPEALAEHLRSRGKIKPRPGSTAERIVTSKDVLHIKDILKDPDGTSNPAPKYGGARTFLGVPMLKDGEVIGAIIIFRQQVRPFTDKQIEVVQSFAAQAVIAIENARLLNDLRQRTNDLSESLQQQTATADVLKVISSSPGELEPVFNTMLENATRICDAEFGTLYLRETDSFRAVAIHNAPPAYVQVRKGNLVRPPPDSALGQVANTHQVAQIDDAKEIKSYVEGNPYAVSAVELGGYRTIAAVPMLKDDELVGAILIYRQEVRRFSEKQIALLQNFAAQAVIAIENARLLNELRESLDQQTSTSEVLKVISSSPGELEPVFQAILTNAVRICEAKFGVLYPYENGRFRPAAEFGVPPTLSEFIQKQGVFRPRSGGTLDCLAQTKQVIYCADLLTEDATNPTAKFGGARTYVAVPAQGK